MENKKKMYFLWCDLETTGLKWNSDDILEAAFTLTTSKMLPLWNEDFVFFHNSSIRDPVVREMHTKNGLLEECRKSSDGVDFANAYLRRRLNSSFDEGVGSVELILAGSTVHFDRRFIDRYMPGLSELLNHRHLDVSVFKTTARALWPEYSDPVESAHRARPDVEQSMSLFRRWSEVIRRSAD